MPMHHILTDGINISYHLNLIETNEAEGLTLSFFIFVAPLTAVHFRLI